MFHGRWKIPFIDASIDAGLFAHKKATTGVHGAGSDYLALSDQEGLVVSKVVWIDAAAGGVGDNNRTVTLDWTALDLSSVTSVKAKLAILQLEMRADTIGAGVASQVGLRKNGTNPSYYPTLKIEAAGIVTGSRIYTLKIVGLDSGQVMQYRIEVGTGWQVDTTISVLGYIE